MLCGYDHKDNPYWLAGMAHEFDFIHTLEARSDSTLEILKSVLQLDTEQMHRTIWGSYLALRAGLDAKESTTKT